jgi:hypothetical protein
LTLALFRFHRSAMVSDGEYAVAVMDGDRGVWIKCDRWRGPWRPSWRHAMMIQKMMNDEVEGGRRWRGSHSKNRCLTGTRPRHVLSPFTTFIRPKLPYGLATYDIRVGVKSTRATVVAKVLRACSDQTVTGVVDMTKAKPYRSNLLLFVSARQVSQRRRV